MPFSRPPGHERKRKLHQVLHCRLCGRSYSQTNSEKLLLGFCSYTCYSNYHNKPLPKGTP